MRHIIFVDGAVGVGKSTFINILAATFQSILRIQEGSRASGKSHHFNVEVLPEPLHRDWTPHIVDGIGYDALLKFLLVRKRVAIETWSKMIASDGLQELESNVLIVERSMQGDRRVADGKLDAFDNINVEYCGESVHYVFIKNVENGANDEQLRLNLLYNELELCGLSDARRSVHRIQRPRHISSYHAEAAGIVRGVLGI